MTIFRIESNREPAVVCTLKEKATGIIYPASTETLLALLVQRNRISDWILLVSTGSGETLREIDFCQSSHKALLSLALANHSSAVWVDGYRPFTMEVPRSIAVDVAILGVPVVAPTAEEGARRYDDEVGYHVCPESQEDYAKLLTWMLSREHHFSFSLEFCYLYMRVSGNWAKRPDAFLRIALAMDGLTYDPNDYVQDLGGAPVDL